MGIGGLEPRPSRSEHNRSPLVHRPLNNEVKYLQQETRTSDSSESFEAIIGSIGFPAEEIKNDLEKWKMSKSEPPAKSDRSNSIPANSG